MYETESSIILQPNFPNVTNYIKTYNQLQESLFWNKITLGHREKLSFLYICNSGPSAVQRQISSSAQSSV